MTNEHRPTNSDELPFALSVLAGIASRHDGLPGSAPPASTPPGGSRRRQLTVEEYVAGVRNGDRTILARAITLIESNAPNHIAQAQEVLREILPFTGNSLRVGITGVPGVGKSTDRKSVV